jgi:predicted Fe-Mo cluster-binding NifX family protein
MVGRGASAVIVTTGQQVAVADVRRSVCFCRNLNLPVAGLVENMSPLACPHCGREVEVFPDGGGERLAAEMNVPFAGKIPLDPRIVLSGDSGEPFAAMDPETPSARAFAAVVERLLGQAQQTQQTPAKEKRSMKIAIPTAEGKLCLHFGHCQQFAMVQADAQSKSVGSVEFLTPPPHEPGVLPRWLHEQGADVIIAGGMGQRAQSLFAQNGIDVVVGAGVDDPASIAAAYLEGTLESGQNVCDH